MSAADPARMWEPSDDLDRILYEVWCGALDAAHAKDQQEEIHECPACGEMHSRLDEAKYIEYQRAYLNHSREQLDALLRRRRS